MVQVDHFNFLELQKARHPNITYQKQHFTRVGVLGQIVEKKGNFQTFVLKTSIPVSMVKMLLHSRN